MDSLFEVSFSSLAASGKPFVRYRIFAFVSQELHFVCLFFVSCGKCRRYMKLIESRPSRLHCETCKETYNLPQGGVIKGFKEARCPLDEFELVQFTGNNNGKVNNKKTNFLSRTIILIFLDLCRTFLFARIVTIIHHSKICVKMLDVMNVHIQHVVIHWNTMEYVHVTYVNKVFSC